MIVSFCSQGVKLDLQTQVRRYLIGDGDFLVIVPFAKKDRHHKHRVETPSGDRNPIENLDTKLADSAWSDLMEDVSTFHERQNPPGAQMNSLNTENENAHERRTSSRKKELHNDKEKEPLDDVLLSILQTSSDNMFNEQNLKRFFDFVDSSSCLTNPATRSCVLREANRIEDSEFDPSKSNTSLCLCPLWLKDIMRAFSFINIYSACLQLWQKKITITALKGAMDQLHKFGFRPGIMDLELLSQICPQVISIVNNEVEATKLHNALVIIKFSADKNDQYENQLVTATKRLARSKIIDSMKKREASLKAILSGVVKSLMLKNGEEKVKSFSLEDLLFESKAGTGATKTEVKRERRRYSAASSSHSYEVQCCDTNSLLPEEMVGHLKSSIGSRGQVVHIEEISARSAKYVEIPCQLSENIKSALNRVGITRLYSHQAESIQASLDGKNVIVATMTSSGKSLCYNIPVLEVLSHNPSACALYLFPTKALAQDQLRALSAMSYGLDDSLNIGIYDGDTSQEDRLWLRNNARLLITNPDMLHVSILPFHGQFSRILSNLRFIVIDEAHVYKGTFGCHVALIFRRLRRICSHVYSSNPSFVFSTATSANPQEHAMELANVPTIELIDSDGSPSGLKLFMLWNPPLCLKTVWKKTKTSWESKKTANKNVVAGRSSPILEVSYLFAEMVQHGLRCIAFCKTRKLCELVLCHTREILHESAPHLVNKIHAYRGGYIAESQKLRIQILNKCGRMKL
ncbi:hypothetical protein BUALT_Bualt07G0079100 [Buddleja alternifolia]|uniref:Helicase ATP-binding domain-containing protein n=1 Tax=Buddleja alternifolia TaxID=168488 RepID=A0AAV6X8Y1_9LAMI|nr:hypothetical protein BUALT_Bualt07G0079100 [Buddleja alternifolia]